MTNNLIHGVHTTALFYFCIFISICLCDDFSAKPTLKDISYVQNKVFKTISNFSDIDECQEGLSDRCDPNSVCSNTIGGYECTCRPGYSGDGSVCHGELNNAMLNCKTTVYCHRRIMTTCAPGHEIFCTKMT